MVTGTAGICIINGGVINGELFKHETRQSVIDYISTLELTKEQKNQKFKYWQDINKLRGIK
jgi:hypothetical protein